MNISEALKAMTDQELSKLIDECRVPDHQSNQASVEAICDTLQARVQVLEEALALILPLAKGYAHAHPVGSNQRYVEIAEQTLAALEEGTK